MTPGPSLTQLRADIPVARDALARCWVPTAMAHPLWMPSIAGLEWLIWDFGDPDAPNFVPTACTDGYKVWINPTFFLGLSPGQRIFLIGHELLHPLLNHLVRLAEHRDDLKNRAADYEINNMLRDYMASNNSPNGAMQWIDGGVADDDKFQFRGMAAEAIAVILADKIPPPEGGGGEGGDEGEDGDEDGDGDGGGNGDGKGKGKGGGKGKGKGGDGEGNGGDDGDSEEERFNKAANSSEASSPGEFTSPAPGSAKSKALRDKWTEIAANTANAARLAGNAPGSWIEKIEGTLASPVDLVSLLDRYLTEYTNNDEGYRPHRPTLHDQGYCVPDDYVEAHGTLVFVKDTSGSVNTREAEAVLACIESAALRLNTSRFVVLDVDTEVAAVQELQRGDSISREFKGRGGTDFRPAFEWTAANADDCRVLLYFTDGEGNFPAVSPDYPVIWINFNKHRVTYPWGEVIDISSFIK